jgi:exodeoxyribonuclease III
MTKLRLFSWNVNGLRAVTNKGELQAFFANFQPDIVGFQEIKASQDQIDTTLFSDYYQVFNSAQRKGYSGTAIYSKIAPLSIAQDIPADIADKYHLTDDQYGDANSEGRVLTAEFEQFYFVTVYTPNTKGDLSRLGLRHQKWDPAFLEYMLRLEQHKPVIFCGDLNVAHQEIDLANPKANRGKHGFTDEERQGFSNFLDAGLIDTLRQFNQQPEQYTWWSHFAKARQRNIGWRIDYFLLSKQLLPKLLSAEIHAEQMGSDHCPISIEIEV